MRALKRVNIVDDLSSSQAILLELVCHLWYSVPLNHCRLMSGASVSLPTREET